MLYKIEAIDDIVDYVCLEELGSFSPWRASPKVGTISTVCTVLVGGRHKSHGFEQGFY